MGASLPVQDRSFPSCSCTSGPGIGQLVTAGWLVLLLPCFLPLGFAHWAFPLGLGGGYHRDLSQASQLPFFL